MDLKTYRKLLRRKFNPVGWSLVGYYVLLNVIVMVVMQLDMAIRLASGSMSVYDPELTEVLMGNGWGYLLASAMGVLILVCWKGTGYIAQQICKRGKPMDAGRFLAIVCVFLSGQLVFQLVISLLETLLNVFGLSVMSSVESATMSADTLSMFLYMGVVAPVVEELLFRGLVLRTLEPFGRKFAIVMSAFLFGIFHGNIVQSPFAFVIGLVLGYTALEYNISWAMLLHMINNLVLADMLGRITAPMGDILSGMILSLILIACAIAAAVIMICNRKSIGAYIRQDRIHGAYVRAFFTNPGIIVLLIMMCLNMALFFIVL